MSRSELHVPGGHEKGEVLSRSQRILYWCVRGVLEVVCRIWFRMEIDGRENLPTNGPFIISPIHRSFLDSPIIGAANPNLMRFMGKESLWTSRPLGWFLSAMGGFPVQRGTADRDALKAALAVIARGEPLVMFPEGTRQSGPTVCHMFDGPSYVACRTGAPIVPVGIGGSESAMPKGKRFVRPVKVVTVIGRPIHPPPLKESGRVSRRAVRELTADLGDAIQNLFDEAQRRAGTPNQHSSPTS
jgi:1-acyl-sn-glycerol-3-phosphate acyltransferase